MSVASFNIAVIYIRSSILTVFQKAQWFSEKYIEAFITFKCAKKEISVIRIYPPVDIKFTDRVVYYNAFDEYYVKQSLSAMEDLFAGYINARLDTYLKILDEWRVIINV